MPLIVSENGLVIQGVAEIIDELNTTWLDPDLGFGPQTNVSDSSTLGRITKVSAGREALVQSALQTLVLNMDPAVAAGYHLDVLCRLSGVERDPAEFAESNAIAAVATGATTIPEDSIIRNDRTQVDWATVGDLVFIGAGTQALTVRARETGEQDFLATDSWTIVTPVSNWGSVYASLDLSAEDAGTDAETDPDLRVKRLQSLIASGNDWDGIQAAVAQVPGVSFVGGLNNDTTGTLDGVPYGAIEVVVEGGDDQEVIEAIFEHLPPGTQTFGDESGMVTMANGEPLEIFYTRPAATNVWVRITVSTVGAEYAARPTLEDEIEAAVLSQAETLFSHPGADVITGAFVGPLWDLSKDALTGRPTLTSIVAETSLNGSTWQTTPLAFTHRFRAEFSASRISVVGL